MPLCVERVHENRNTVPSVLASSLESAIRTGSIEPFSLLEGRGSGAEWRFRVRFGSRDHFADFREHFLEFGAVTVHQRSAPETPGDVSYGVTAKQRAALLTAYDEGYYDSPESASGEAVARRLGITSRPSPCDSSVVSRP